MPLKLGSSLSIAVDKTSCEFSASHAVISNDYVEGIHGHNYLAEVEIKGTVDSDEILIDFIFLDNLLQVLTSEWNHYVLIPNQNPHLKIKENGENLELQYGERFYSIPGEEIKLLTCTNVTTEVLARLLGNKVVIELKKKDFWSRLKVIKITIWETTSYKATYTINLAESENQEI